MKRLAILTLLVTMITLGLIAAKRQPAVASVLLSCSTDCHFGQDMTVTGANWAPRSTVYFQYLKDGFPVFQENHLTDSKGSIVLDYPVGLYYLGPLPQPFTLYVFQSGGASVTADFTIVP